MENDILVEHLQSLFDTQVHILAVLMDQTEMLGTLLQKVDDLQKKVDDLESTQK
ncbi:hypothetical protein J6Z48_01755 [bacterium]|nr:hypothetical protein [bacterium]